MIQLNWTADEAHAFSRAGSRFRGAGVRRPHRAGLLARGDSEPAVLPPPSCQPQPQPQPHHHHSPAPAPTSCCALPPPSSPASPFRFINEACAELIDMAREEEAAVADAAARADARARSKAQRARRASRRFAGAPSPATTTAGGSHQPLTIADGAGNRERSPYPVVALSSGPAARTPAGMVAEWFLSRATTEEREVVQGGLARLRQVEEAGEVEDDEGPAAAPAAAPTAPTRPATGCKAWLHRVFRSGDPPRRRARGRRGRRSGSQPQAPVINPQQAFPPSPPAPDTPPATPAAASARAFGFGGGGALLWSSEVEAAALFPSPLAPLPSQPPPPFTDQPTAIHRLAWQAGPTHPATTGAEGWIEVSVYKTGDGGRVPPGEGEVSGPAAAAPGPPTPGVGEEDGGHGGRGRGRPTRRVPTPLSSGEAAVAVEEVEEAAVPAVYGHHHARRRVPSPLPRGRRPHRPNSQYEAGVPLAATPESEKKEVGRSPSPSAAGGVRPRSPLSAPVRPPRTVSAFTPRIRR